MRAFRSHIRSAVAATLLLQLAAYLALPTALCCESQHEMATASAVEHRAAPAKPCCPGMAPGQVCPMHGGSTSKARSKGASDCRIKCARGSDFSMPPQGFAGPLVARVFIDPMFALGAPVSILSVDAPGVDVEPTSPPPRRVAIA